MFTVTTFTVEKKNCSLYTNKFDSQRLFIALFFIHNLLPFSGIIILRFICQYYNNLILMYIVLHHQRGRSYQFRFIPQL